MLLGCGTTLEHRELNPDDVAEQSVADSFVVEGSTSSTLRLEPIPGAAAGTLSAPILGFVATMQRADNDAVLYQLVCVEFRATLTHASSSERTETLECVPRSANTVGMKLSLQRHRASASASPTYSLTVGYDVQSSEQTAGYAQSFAGAYSSWTTSDSSPRTRTQVQLSKVRIGATNITDSMRAFDLVTEPCFDALRPLVAPDAPIAFAFDDTATMMISASKAGANRSYVVSTRSEITGRAYRGTRVAELAKAGFEAL